MTTSTSARTCSTNSFDLTGFANVFSLYLFMKIFLLFRDFELVLLLLMILCVVR